MDEGTEQPQDLNSQIAQRLFGMTWRSQTAIWMGHDCPAYTTDPAATALVWQWVEAQSGLREVCFSYDRAGRRRTVRCDLVYGPPRTRGPYGCAKGAGATMPEALCRAALALAEALEKETP